MSQIVSIMFFMTMILSIINHHVPHDHHVQDHAQAHRGILLTLDPALVDEAASGLALQVLPDVGRSMDPTVRPEISIQIRVSIYLEGKGYLP